jgi:3-hydroxyacyl-CoA dehydrogenase
VAKMVAYAKRLGKSPIVVGDGPGFLVNRLLLPYMHEAVQLLVEGVPLKAIDKAAKTFGMPMGPLELYDIVGLDTAMHAGAVMHFAFPDRVSDSPLLRALYGAGRLGQKSGAGFYSYRNKKKRAEPDPALDEFIRPLLGGKSQPEKLSGEQLADRLFLPMLLEATRVLEEHVARDARDVDLGLIFGIGFPPFRGGLLFWADTLGASAILKRLEPYQSLGARYAPTPMLLKMARKVTKFYDEK